MTKSPAFKGCLCCTLLLLVAGCGILAWQLLLKDDDNSDVVTTTDKGGLFGTGFFAGDNNDNNNDNNTATFSPISATTGPASTSTLSEMAPSAAPSSMPTEFQYKYSFDQLCSSSSSSDIQCCNGLANLCDYPVNDILFASLHNAMATDDLFIIPNQLRPVKEALQAGFRGINVDVCNCGGQWKLCHGFCGIGEVDPAEFMGDIVAFLQQPENQNEVLLLTMELNSDAGQPVDLTAFYNSVLGQVEGFEEYLYIHDGPGQPWPSLATMIENNKRLIAFHFNGPDCSEEGSCPQGMHYYFQYAQETEFDLPSVEAILDTETSCIITRGATSTDGSFFGVNNFVTASAFDLDNQLIDAANANSLDFANQRLQACSKTKEEGVYYGDANVNMLYVDFWSVGDIVQVVQEYNWNLGAYSGN